jgi:hypothetical protein
MRTFNTLAPGALTMDAVRARTTRRYVASAGPALTA